MTGEGRLRLAHVHVLPGFGGSERYILNLVQGLDPSRFALTMLCTGTRGPVGDRLVEAGMEVRYVSTDEELVAAMRGFDVVHTHWGGGEQRERGNVAACQAGVPVKVETYHWPEATMSEELDAIVCPTALNAQLHRRSGHVAAVVEIPIGVDLEQFAPRPVAKDRPPVIGRVSRLVYEKDPFTFLKAVAHIHARRPEVRFLVVGSGPPARAPGGGCSRVTRRIHR